MTREERFRELDELALATLRRWAACGSKQAAALLRRYGPNEDGKRPGLAGNGNATTVAQKRATSAGEEG